VLSVRSLKRKLPHGSEYRVRYGESLLMADEIFHREVYKDPFEGREAKAFVDLGSNVGRRIRRSSRSWPCDRMGLAPVLSLATTISMAGVACGKRCT
jgi:hypothetical protein